MFPFVATFHHLSTIENNLTSNLFNQDDERITNSEYYPQIRIENSFKRQRSKRQFSIDTSDKSLPSRRKSEILTKSFNQNKNWINELSQIQRIIPFKQSFSLIEEGSKTEVSTLKQTIQTNSLNFSSNECCKVGNGLSVLIVDDNSVALKLLQHHLKSLGCSVSFVSDGHVCLELFTKFKEKQQNLLASHKNENNRCFHDRKNSYSVSIQTGEFNSNSDDSDSFNDDNCRPSIRSKRSYNEYIKSKNFPTFLSSVCDGGDEPIIESPFDLVFMDGSMPILDGYNCVRSIRQLGFDTYIIACTSNSAPEEIELFKESGVQQVIIKPVLEETIKTALTNFRKKQTENE